MSDQLSATKKVKRHRAVNPKIFEFAVKNRENKRFANVRIEFGRRADPILANRLILCCCSEVFDETFKDKKTKSAKIDAVDEESMKTLIDYMYTGTIEINNDNVLLLLAGANHLRMEEVKEFCAQFLDSTLTIASCFSTLRTAQQYSLQLLQDSVYRMIGESFEQFVGRDDFKTFSLDDLKSCILKLSLNGQINDQSIYRAILLWIKHYTVERKKYLSELMKLVEFDKIPRQFLEEKVSKEPLVKEDLDCANMVMTSLVNLLGNKPKVIPRNSKILSVGGRNTSKNLIEVFNNRDDDSKLYPEMPIKVDGGWSVRMNAYIYCGEGRATSMNAGTNRVFRMKLEDCSFEDVAPLNNPRYGASATFFRDKLVITGGSNRGQRLSSAECYIPKVNQWESIAPTNKAKDSNALVCCKGCLYDIGGWNGTEVFSSVERLKELKGANWAFVKPMQTKRFDFAAVAYNDCVFVLGGKSGEDQKTTKSVEKYHPSSDAWTFVPNMKNTRSGHAACLFLGKIYVVGGRNEMGEVVKEIECYDPTKEKWSVAGHTIDELCNHSVVVV